jgi:hypothetical protein
MAPLTLLASSLCGQQMVAVSCSAVATDGIVLCMIGPRTRAPSRARRSAVARPMPEPAPVTMAVLPVKRPAVNGGSGTPWPPASASSSGQA